jgi:hypothetical protein
MKGIVTKEQGMNAIVKKAGLMLVVALLFVGVAAWAGEENGRLYTWTDKDGVTHVTDSLQNVPQQYRSKTQRVGDGGPGVAVVPESQSPAPPATSVQGGGSDATLKAQWQSRMLDAKRQLQYAEDKYGQLTKRKSDLQAQWGSGGAALPPQEVLDEMNRLDADMSSAKAEIDRARDQINNVIPDEARKAGVPPGWLREVE